MRHIEFFWSEVVLKFFLEFLDFLSLSEFWLLRPSEGRAAVLEASLAGREKGQLGV